MLEKIVSPFIIRAVDLGTKILFLYSLVKYHLSSGRKAAYPLYITVDPVNICNLRCPLCATNHSKYKKEMMSFPLFKNIIDKVPSAKVVNLFNWGETFLNPDIFKMIAYAKSREYITTIHSNFSLNKDDEFFQKIVKSGLDVLVLSIDGASRESYSKYRVGGNFERVLENIGSVVRMKKHLNSKKPKIIWKFVVNQFNEHEIEKAEEMAKEYGISFVTDKMGLGDDLPDIQLEESIEERKRYWLPENRDYLFPRYMGNYKPPLFNGVCVQLFTTMIINPDGKVFPCCWLANEDSVFGDLKNDSFDSIWNNKYYRYSRELFTQIRGQWGDFSTICKYCNNYRKKIS